jgi:hypothetical protein
MQHTSGNAQIVVGNTRTVLICLTETAPRRTRWTQRSHRALRLRRGAGALDPRLRVGCNACTGAHPCRGVGSSQVVHPYCLASMPAQLLRHVTMRTGPRCPKSQLVRNLTHTHTHSLSLLVAAVTISSHHVLCVFAQCLARSGATKARASLWTCWRSATTSWRAAKAARTRGTQSTTLRARSTPCTWCPAAS